MIVYNTHSTTHKLPSEYPVRTMREYKQKSSVSWNNKIACLVLSLALSYKRIGSMIQIYCRSDGTMLAFG